MGTFVLAAHAGVAMADQITGTKTPGYPGQLAIRIAGRVGVALVGVGVLLVVRNGVSGGVSARWRGGKERNAYAAETGM